MNDDEAHCLLVQPPTLFSYLSDIREKPETWKSHRDKFTSAVAMLAADEPFSLRHMAPPPLTEPFGSATEGVRKEWCQAHPSHPWARTVTSNYRELSWIHEMKHGATVQERPVIVEAYRDSRRAAEEICAWAYLVPEAFDRHTVAVIEPSLLHWDAGVVFKMIRASYRLGLTEHVLALKELMQCLEQYDLADSWSYAIAKVVLNEWTSE